jgi:hypothetical protein
MVLMAIVSCDSGEPQPNIGDRAAAKINDTAMNVYFIKIRSAAQKHRADRGRYPETIDDLVETGFLDAPSATDPWGNPWVLSITPDGELTITSYGADGAPGGNDAARDRISR